MGQVYCQPADLLTTGVNPLALQDVSLPEQTVACQQASELADSWGFRPRYGNVQPILVAWGPDVTMQTARVAVYLILSARGYMPDAGADSLYRLNYDEAKAWFMGVGHQSVHPDVTPNTQMNQNRGPDLPQFSTQPQRGWTQTNNGTPSVS